VKVVKGVVEVTNKVRESKKYTVVNRNEQERLVLVEHPVRNEFKLVDTAKPAETASDFYRFQIKVAPGKTETLTVTEERVVSTQTEFANTNDDQLRFFLSQTAGSRKVKDGLKQAQALRWNLEKTRREIQELERQLTVITEDQGRLRANLREVPATSAAYKRYLEKFDRQETQIEQYQADIKKLQGVEHDQKKEFDDFLANFSAD
jgi:chromosome segregation ATPase